jgi:hypothetical protein
MLDLCKDGTLSYRRRAQLPFNGVALPVFSVDTEEQAREAQVHFCRRQWVAHPYLPGQPWYRWTDFDGEVGSLEGVSVRLAAWWDEGRHGLPERARAVIRKAQAAGVEVGSGVDLLLDNLPELVDVMDARHVLAHIGYVKGEVLK